MFECPHFLLENSASPTRGTVIFWTWTNIFSCLFAKRVDQKEGKERVMFFSEDGCYCGRRTVGL